MARRGVAVVGGGILGLACALELTRRHPRLPVELLEREAGVGRHQSSHNSGVVHAGVYYAPGSLKARLCREGMRRMYELCEAEGIDCRRVGKLIVATGPEQLGRLDDLEERARANGVPGLRRLRGAAAIAGVEPAAAGLEALHSPQTGIVDYLAVCEALARRFREAGGTITTGARVERVSAAGGRLTIGHSSGETVAARALFCAGAWSDRLAVAAGADPDPRIVPFRGAYLELRRERAALLRGMLYPVPDPALPFLGVHVTRHVDDSVTIGPTALLSPALRAGSLRLVEPRTVARTLTWPGTARMAWRYRAAAREELRHALSRRALVAAATRYLPSLELDDVVGEHAGVRAQALARDGTLVDDFAFSETERALHVRNAPSPGATSSLAIAGYVVDRLEAGGDLT
ncbi:MAG TPA: L-2-hydroxyglutarate oxidase [Solirubrobacterales bacterium]|nr:L-2-hydroxyglutarate oxidase [Solirubrobacterales bacterium]